MIFPKDVGASVSRANKLSGSEKTRTIILGFVVGNGAVFLLIAPFIRGFGVPTWLILVGQIVLTLIIGVYLWRVMIFNEDEKILEMEDRSSDSFSRMYFLRNIDAGETVKFGSLQVPIFEFDNGTVKFMLRLRFGETNEARSQATKRVLEQIYQIIRRNRLEFRETISKEDFSSSPEAARYRKKISKIPESPVLSRTMLDITKVVFDLSDRFSNVDMITITVKTRSSYQKYDLPSVVSQISSVLRENLTSFRSAEFMYKMDVLAYYKEFYKLNAIDLTAMKIKSGNRRLDTSRSSVRLYQFIDENGEVWTQDKVHDQILGNDMRIARKLDL